MYLGVDFRLPGTCEANFSMCGAWDPRSVAYDLIMENCRWTGAKLLRYNTLSMSIMKKIFIFFVAVVASLFISGMVTLGFRLIMETRKINHDIVYMFDLKAHDLYLMLHEGNYVATISCCENECSHDTSGVKVEIYDDGRKIFQSQDKWFYVDTPRDMMVHVVITETNKPCGNYTLRIRYNGKL